MQHRVRSGAHTFTEELGAGANGTVFRAIDELLGREVAIKIWNARGARRSQEEISKIAQFQDPLVVSTYRFSYANETPYAIMELAKGISGKAWLKGAPQLRKRIRFWGRYSEALQMMHNVGIVHGDPHLGNTIVWEPTTAPAYSEGNAREDFLFKIADTGTSVFWKDHGDFQARERNLILETAKLLFKSYGLGRVFEVPKVHSHSAAIALIDGFVEYLWRVSECVDWGRRSENASIIADHLIAVPLFNFDAVFQQVKETGVTDRGRLSRRLNAKVMQYSDLDTAEIELRDETLQTLDEKKHRLIRSLESRIDPELTLEKPGYSSYRHAPWY